MTDENAKVSVDQYGRKTWDIEAYAKDARTIKSNSKNKTESSSTIASKLSISSDKPTSYLHHRAKLLSESISSVNKHTLINPLNTSSYGKDKKFGFFCPVCDLSFRDNLALIDHVNSPQHVGKCQELTRKLKAERGIEDNVDDLEILDGGIRRASVDEVISTIELLVAQLIQNKKAETTGLSIHERIKRRQLFEQKKLERRRFKRLNQKIKQKEKEKEKQESNQNDSKIEHEIDFSSMMGFTGFSSTKK